MNAITTVEAAQSPEAMILSRRLQNRLQYGEECHADGTRATPRRLAQERTADELVEVQASSGGPTWLALLKQEVARAAIIRGDAPHEDVLIDQLADVGAVVAAWIEDLQRRQAARK